MKLSTQLDKRPRLFARKVVTLPSIRLVSITTVGGKVGIYDMVSYIVLIARYWDDPHSFKPSRFLGDWPRDAFLPFSAGKNEFNAPESDNPPPTLVRAPGMYWQKVVVDIHATYI